MENRSLVCTPRLRPAAAPLVAVSSSVAICSGGNLADDPENPKFAPCGWEGGILARKIRNWHLQ